MEPPRASEFSRSAVKISRFVNYIAIHDSQQYLRILYIIHRDIEEVSVHNDDVRQLSGSSEPSS